MILTKNVYPKYDLGGQEVSQRKIGMILVISFQIYTMCCWDCNNNTDIGHRPHMERICKDKSKTGAISGKIPAATLYWCSALGFPLHLSPESQDPTNLVCFCFPVTWNLKSYSRKTTSRLQFVAGILLTNIKNSTTLSDAMRLIL